MVRRLEALEDNAAWIQGGKTVTGSDFNFGPPSFWKALFWLAIIGLIAVLGSLAYGAFWLVQHLEFKP